MLIDKSIVFDFEGFAPSFGQAGIPKPHFVGVYDLSKQGEAKYCWYAFQPEWKPAVNGSRSPAELTVLAECFQHLLAQVKKNGGMLIHWSQHEHAALTEHLEPELLRALEPYLLNARKAAKKYLRKNGLVDSVVGLTLADFYRLICPNQSPMFAFPRGPAEACRKIDRACAKTQRWRNFSQLEQLLMHDLISYNKDDCLATARIVNKVFNSLTID